jgi:protein-S-isoprenylcysteine O-methyltransferase Ste14
VFVTDGVYRRTRNPQYLGYALALGGGALNRRSALGLLLTAAIAGVFAWWVPVEERHLIRLHGARYAEYLKSTRRWL